MSAIRGFFVGVAKVTVGIVLSVVVLSLLGWAGYAYYQHRESVKNAPLAIAKDWPVITVTALENVRFSLRTMWRDGKMSYQFQIIGYPEKIAAARDGKTPRSSSGGEFTLIFLDEAGFKVMEHKVRLGEMTLGVNDKGEGRGLEIKGHTYVDADDYRRAARWEASWAL
jgi:hypothetical protein